MKYFNLEIAEGRVVLSFKDKMEMIKEVTRIASYVSALEFNNEESQSSLKTRVPVLIDFMGFAIISVNFCEKKNGEYYIRYFS